MAQQSYFKNKNTPLTKDEIKEKLKEIQDEMREVLKWKKEEELKLKDSKASPQKKGATKRALKKATRRVDTVQGQIIYWKLRANGESHFKASLEKNEFWGRCREKEEEKKNKLVEKNLPEILKNSRRN
jgi:hypothetical protein